MWGQVKTKIVFAAIIVYFAAPIHSQGIYVSSGAGYGMSTASNTSYGTDKSSNYIVTYDGISTTDAYTNTYKNIKGTGSFGKGIQSGGIIGYMFKKHLGAELGIGYLKGTGISNKNTLNEQYIDLTNYNNNSNTSSAFEASSAATTLRFTPALRITASKGKVKPYMRMGLVIGVANKIKATYKSTHIDYGIHDVYAGVSEVSGGVSLGFAGGLGIDFKWKNNIGFYVETSIITQSWAPKKGRILESTLNGINELPFMTVHDKETVFVDNYSASSASAQKNVDEFSPRKELAIRLPLSSAGLNVGIRLFLVKK